jgi:DNA-binding phage protein
LVIGLKDTVQARAKSDAKFRRALLREGIESFLTGDVDTGKAIIRDYINATIGFTTLGGKTKTSPKSLMRMFGPAGNPQARKLFAVIACLQKQGRVHLKIQ